MINEIALQENEIEKKERLAQTYIVIFGLLLASSQNENTQQYLGLIFFFFLITIIPYYTFLTNIKTPIKNEANDPSNLINLCAVFASFSLGLAIVVFTYPILNDMYFSITIPLLNFITSIFTSDFGNCSIAVKTRSITGLSSLPTIQTICMLPQCCLLTIVIAYSLVIIPRELKDDDPIKEIITMIKILTNMK